MYETRTLAIASSELLRSVDRNPELGSVELEIVTPRGKRAWRAVRRAELARHVQEWMQSHELTGEER
jgi:hypothetical protein